MNYTVYARFEPKKTGLAAYNDPDYQALTKKLAADLEVEFRSRFSSFRIGGIPAEPPHNSIGNIYVTTPDLKLFFEIHRWIHERAGELIKPVVGVDRPKDPLTIVHARWVTLAVDVPAVDSDPRTYLPINEYPTACARCRWPDLERVPNPYRVHPNIANPKNAKLEMFSAHNGMFIVNARLRDAFQNLAGNEMTSGNVVVDDRPDLNGAYFWIRPKQTIGDFIGERESEERCPDCGIAERRFVDESLPHSSIVTNFGPLECNFARIGRFTVYSPLHEKRRWMPQRHPVAVSGGLFAAIYNQGVKDLAWPQVGPLLSALEDQSPLEERRRFADVFPKSKDKVLKKNVE